MRGGAEPAIGAGCSILMQNSEYYRREAAHARRLCAVVHQTDLIELLKRLAEDYDDIAEDLEAGLIEIRHAGRLPQSRHHR